MLLSFRSARRQEVQQWQYRDRGLDFKTGHAETADRLMIARVLVGLGVEGRGRRSWRISSYPSRSSGLDVFGVRWRYVFALLWPLPGR